MAPIFASLLALSGFISTAYCLPSTERRSTDTTLDLTAVSSGLPSPTATPLIIALGVGTQNYTCDSTTGTYSSNVAIADLYDIASLVKPSTKDGLSKLYLQKSTECSSDDPNPLQLSLIGDHYFDSSSKPNFDFAKSNRGWLQAKKGANVAAPATAAKGAQGDAYGTIDWLYLLDNGDGVSEDLLSVYRVWTAGGKPPSSCSGDQQIEIPYAAEYWFYDATF